MAEADQKFLPVENGHVLLDRPEEEKLRAEIEALKKQLEEERKRSQKSNEKKPEHPKRRTLWWLAVALVLLFLLVFFLGWLPRHRRQQQLAKEAREEQQALPEVSVLQAKRSPSNAELNLPGNIQAITEAPILARADGFLAKRYVDIGDRVKQGQLMAVIEAPDLDQQVRQAQAQLSQAEAALKQADSNLSQGVANEQLARITANRYANLEQRGAVSRQDNDTYQSQYAAQVANVAALNQAVSAAKENVSAAQANLNRLIALQSFENVRAPFDGIVTYRNLDVGALISTGSTLIFRVAQVDRLRTYIFVPQPNASGVRVGQPATLTTWEFPGRKFAGVVTRTADALDPNTRTLTTEVQLPNPDHVLLPGMFVQTNLVNPRTNPPILVPDASLIISSQGIFVAVVHKTGEVQNAPPSEQNKGKQIQQKNGQNQKKSGQSESGEQRQSAPQNQPEQVGIIHLQAVSVGRDYGTDVEIPTGVNPGDLVVSNPSDAVRENAKVRFQLTRETPAGGPKQPGGAVTNENSEILAPEPGGTQIPTQPTKEKQTRGPGY